MIQEQNDLILKRARLQRALHPSRTHALSMGFIEYGEVYTHHLFFMGWSLLTPEKYRKRRMSKTR